MKRKRWGMRREEEKEFEKRWRMKIKVRRRIWEMEKKVEGMKADLEWKDENDKD